MRCKNNHAKLIFYSTAFLFACFNLYAESESNKAESSIKAVFAPISFDQGYVRLSLTNVTNIPIKVASKLQGHPGPYAQPDLVYIAMFIKKIPGINITYTTEEMNSMVANDHEPDPLEIKPGETKAIKFSLPKYYTKAAKGLSGVKLTITWNNITIQTMEFSKLDNIWNPIQ